MRRLFLLIACYLHMGWPLSGATAGTGMQPSAMANTNVFYIDDTANHRLVGGLWIVDEKVLVQARRAKDSQPAVDDPGGNWGLPFNGLQFSLRFEKEAYSSDEPIVARLLLRNIGDTPRSLVEVNYGLPNYRFVVTTGTKELVPRKSSTSLDGIAGGDASVDIKDLHPGYQHRDTVVLSGLFSFDRTGTYYITAVNTTIPSDLGGCTELASGTAVIRITAIAAPPNNDQKGDGGTLMQAVSIDHRSSGATTTANKPAAGSKHLQLAPTPAKSTSTSNPVDPTGNSDEESPSGASYNAGSNALGTIRGQSNRLLIPGLLLLLSIGLVGYIILRAAMRSKSLREPGKRGQQPGVNVGVR